MADLRRQHGVALITTLLVVALATTVAVAMVERQQLDIRRTGNQIQRSQALAYATGIEQWSAQLLRRDAEKSKVDHLGEDWATVLPPIPVDGGQLSGRLLDLQGRINLNGIVDANQQLIPLTYERLRRLLEKLEIDPDLALAIADWIDVDGDLRFPGGAEDNVYLGFERPYRCANRPFNDISELRLVNGITPEIYDKLLPHVTVLPDDKGINVNTASLEVLTSLANGISDSAAQSLLDDRDNAAFEDVGLFVANNALAGIDIDKTGLTVESHYFMVEATVLMELVRYPFTTVMRRDPNLGAVALLRNRRGF